MKDPDVQLIRFYHAVIEEEIKLHPSATHKESLKKMKSLHSPNAFKTAESGTSLILSTLRCAYAYHHGPCLTSTLVSHFRQLFKRNSLLLQTIVLRRTLKMCCLSAGLATEFVALVSVLEEMLRKYYSGTSSLVTRLHFEVVVVVVVTESDSDGMAQKMAENLSQLVDMSAFRFEIRFVPADFTKPLTDDVKESLSQSDFVTVVHFLSIIHGDASSLQIIQEITPFIREGGVLFYLDPPEFHLCDTVRQVIGTSEHMKEIYGPLIRNIHRLSFLCRKECLRLYSKYYGWRSCALESVNYVCAWYKRASVDQSPNAVSFSRLINDPSLFI